MAVNKRDMAAICRILLACFLISYGFSDLNAQQHFKPLKDGEYEIVEEDTRYHPGAQIHGSYEAIASDRKNGLVTGKSLGGNFYQDISLMLRSKINTNVSLNVKLGHESPVVSDQDRPYETRNPSDRTTTADGDGFNVTFEEAFLEYNHNPNAQLRLGRQYITIGDRRGLVFEGEATAATQGCRIGTWCYSIGGARLGDEGRAGVFWAQLDYPVYESGVLIPDPWGIKPTRQEKSFSVELFRVMYGGNDVPTAEYGGWTGEYSDAHDTTDDAASGDDVYFDNDGVEYIGMNILWNYYDFDLHFTWSNMNGTRNYFARDRTSRLETDLGSRSVSGNAYLLDLGYRMQENWKTTLTLFSASGNSLGSQNEKLWEKNSTAYHEIQKGAFGDALIYFNGKNGIGDGHSVSNLTFYALKFAYREKVDEIGADMGLYLFSRTKPVYTNEKGAAAAKGSDIGAELDVSVNWRLEERLTVQFHAAYFDPGSAYAVNDSVRPDDNTSPFTLLGVGGRYTF